MKSIKYVVIGIAAFLIITSFATVSGVLANINIVNKMEENINRLQNDISIEQEEIKDIQAEMKDMVQEYTGYEKESNELVVENLDPKLVVNMYPELKSSNMYNNLNRQYLKSMRKIKDSKTEYNNSAEDYNQRLVTFKGRLLHGNREKKEYIK